MNEVLGRAVAAIVDNMRQVGVPTEAALARLPIREAALRNSTCRIDWSSFVDFVEVGEASAGGPQALARAFSKAQPRMFSEFLPVFRFVLSPRDLYRLSHALIRMAYPNLRVADVEYPDGRLVVTIEIPEPHRPCRAFLNACSGGLRAVPEIIGLPHVEVDAQLSPRRGVFTFVLPESQTVVARLRRRSVPVIVKAAVAEIESSWVETRRRISELEAQNDRVRELTKSLEDAEESGRRAEVALRAALEASASSMFLVAADGTVTPLDDTASAALAAEGEGLARRVIRVAQGEMSDPALVARAAGPNVSGGQIVIRSDAARAFAARLDRNARSWHLTDRHIEVTALVVRGLSNKEIAARLDCAVHTIEIHVTELLKRSNLATRSALIAAFWSDDPSRPVD